MKINLVGLLFDRNMGDPLLFDCTKYLLNEVFHSCSKDSATDSLVVEYTDFERRLDFAPQKVMDFDEEPVLNESKSLVKSLLKYKVFGSLNNVRKYSKRCKYVKDSRQSLYRQELNRYYKERFEGCDLVVIIGAGTLKYHVRMDFGNVYEPVIETCSDLNIPVVVSCVGVESPYDRLDPRCTRLVKCLNKANVKYITTRDGLSHLRPYIKRKGLMIDTCADVGVYASQTYNVKKAKDSDVIGIGIITYKRFVEFAKGIAKEQYERIIFEIIKVLEKRNKHWMFFNNGDNEDASYQKYLCTKWGYSTCKMMKTPESPRELVVNISKMGGVITSRLHSCIVSYSLDIPYVAIAWNDKLYRFSENIGRPDAVVGKNELNAENIVDLLERYQSAGYMKDARQAFLQTTYNCFKRYLF